MESVQGVVYMTLTVRQPPMLLHYHPIPIPSFETLLSTAESNNIETDITQLTELIRHAKTDNYNQYIFCQCLMWLYANIFIGPYTIQVFRNILDNCAIEIFEAYQSRKITDKFLNDLIRLYFKTAPGKNLSIFQTDEFCELLNTINNRVVPDNHLKNLLDIVITVYDPSVTKPKTVTPYRINLITLEGHELPTLRFIPIENFEVILQVETDTETQDLLWRFIDSISLSTVIKQADINSSSNSNLTNLTITQFMINLAKLAVPLDPVELYTSLKTNLLVNNKSSIPIVNYLAMYFRQLIMGTQYKLSRLADPRRFLMEQMHKFCGIGATSIINPVSLERFVRKIKSYTQLNISTPPSTDCDILLNLEVVFNNTSIQFTRKLNYSESFESVSPDTTKLKDPSDSDKKSTKNDTSSEKDKVFSDDKDPTTIDSSETPDDTIDQADDSGQAASVRATSRLLVLALPSETIDDHLYRLSVLRFASSLIVDTEPEVTAETVDLLKVWCGTLLFIASANTTKNLLTQLKLTEKLKEFVE